MANKSNEVGAYTMRVITRASGETLADYWQADDDAVDVVIMLRRGDARLAKMLEIEAMWPVN